MLRVRREEGTENPRNSGQAYAAESRLEEASHTVVSGSIDP